MRKVPVLILLLVFCLFNNRLYAQACYVSITNTNTVLNCVDTSITLITAKKILQHL